MIPPQNPGQLLEISGYYWKTATLHAAVKLGVFTVAGDDTLSAEAIAEKLGAQVRSTSMLLNALCAMGLMTQTDGQYRNTDLAVRHLVKEAPGYVGYMIMHHHHLAESWFRMDQSIVTGAPVRERASFSDDEWRESFLMGMFNNAMAMAPKVVAAIDLADHRRLLDLGGGPGTYAIHFCQGYANLTATVVDLPTTRPYAEATIARFGLTDRIRFEDGNYVTESIPGTYDVAWLSHILHGEGPDTCQEIVHKAVSALEAGGIILIHEFILDDTLDAPLFPALFSLNMLLGTESGQAYSQGQLERMMTDAGVQDIRRLPFTGPTESGILMGTV